VPETAAAAKELLLFGLQSTDKKVLFQVADSAGLFLKS